MRRRSVQDPILPLQRRQERLRSLSNKIKLDHTLFSLSFLSYSSFFMISCSWIIEQRKEKLEDETISERKEKDQQGKRLLTLFLSFSPMLGVREAYSILWIPQNPNREGAIFITSTLPPANTNIYEPVFRTPLAFEPYVTLYLFSLFFRNRGQLNSWDSPQAPFIYFNYDRGKT